MWLALHLILKEVPNIVTDELHLNNFDAIKNTSYKIINIYGQPVSEGVLLKNYIDVSALSNGNYYLLLNNENNLIPMKFIKF